MLFGAVYPHPENIPGFGGNTKYFHVLGFLVLSIIVLKTFDLFKFKHSYMLAILFILIFSILTESLQLLVPTRHFLYTDMLIDIAGAVVGIVAYRLLLHKTN